MNIREKIKQYKNKHELSQKDLSKLMGISERQVRYVLAGEKQPGSKTYAGYFKLPGVQRNERIENDMNQLRKRIEELEEQIEYLQDNIDDLYQTINEADPA